MIRYSWRKGSRFGKLSADVAGREIEKIRKANGGRLTAGVVVEAAAAARSPLHGCFVWDDTEAARIFREDQARNLLRHIAVVYEPAKQTAPVHAYVVVERDGAAHYTTTKIAAASEDLWTQVLLRAKNDLESADRELASFLAFKKPTDGRVDRRPIRRVISGVNAEMEHAGAK